MVLKNTYRVVFRESTVVFDRMISARTMTKAARKATKLTRAGAEFAGWSVYSITLI